MSDPRDLAVRWLAGRLDHLAYEFGFDLPDSRVAAAEMLAQPGVEVTTRYDCHTGIDEVAVWLPAEASEAPEPDGAADKAAALNRAIEWYLDTQHRQTALHDHLGAGLSCMGCLLLAVMRGEVCCDSHNRFCEPLSELCCEACTEATHPVHADGSTCSAPDLNGTGARP